MLVDREWVPPLPPGVRHRLRYNLEEGRIVDPGKSESPKASDKPEDKKSGGGGGGSDQAPPSEATPPARCPVTGATAQD